ncbi:MAG: flagellar M-ring protein FliF [Eubacteriaceae bacterium]|nr:flagellar M-ring protein FliF [Eubacteriaceae bacterium]
MNEQIKRFLGSIKQFWAGLSRQSKGLLIGGAVIIIVGALALTILMNTKNYVPLFDNLSEAENTEILGQLQTMNVSVKLDSSNNIMVPKADESSIRMALATAGYPKNGLSYYMIQDNSSMLSTDYERKQYENMQLQERIGASIETLDGVKDAVVTISVPTENVFYLQETEKPTASVIIRMNPGNTLTESQVLGIRNLVAKSFTGLSKDNIALSDSQGNDLINSAAASGGNNSKIKITREIENDIKKKVAEVLNGPYDSSKYKISVSAMVNTDALTKESTVYTPSPAGNNNGVINQESTSQSVNGTTGTTNGVAGTTSNTQVTTYAEGTTTGTNPVTDTTDSKTYSVSQDKTQMQKTDPVVESVSIGIALDDVTLNPTEQENLIQLVAFAAGVAPESIAIRNFKFSTQDNVGTTNAISTNMNQLLLYGAIGGGVLLLIVLVFIIILVIRGKKNKDPLGLDAELAGDEQGAMDELFGKMSQHEITSLETIKDEKTENIKDFAKANPEIVAQLFKSWLKNEKEF